MFVEGKMGGHCRYKGLVLRCIIHKMGSNNQYDYKHGKPEHSKKISCRLDALSVPRDLSDCHAGDSYSEIV